MLTDSDGYDGQFYYRLSLDPFTTRNTDFGVTLDDPAYRQQRIFYPFLVWMFSGGGRFGVPLQMIVVNFVALIWIGWIGANFAQRVHRHAWWGLLFPLYPGFILSLSRNLTEILQTALLLSALYFLQNAKKMAPLDFDHRCGIGTGNRIAAARCRGLAVFLRFPGTRKPIPR